MKKFLIRFLLLFVSLIILGNIVNAAAPVLDDGTGSIDENSSVGTIVGTYTGSDVDGDTLTYSILSGNDNNTFTIDNNTAEITLSGSVDYETQTGYTLIVEVNDGSLTDTGAIVIDVINDITQPVFDSIITTSNNSKNNNFAKEGDKIAVLLTINPEDTWKVGNKAIYSIGTSTGETNNFTSKNTPKSSATRNVTINSGYNGDFAITDLIFEDWEGNTITGVVLPASNIIVDTIAPDISFTDNIASGPVQSDILNITVSELNTDTGSYQYAFTDNTICTGSVVFTENFTSGSGITFNDESHNNKYICVKAEDAAGNVSYLVSANKINIDTTIPTVLNSNIISNNSNSGSWAKVGDEITLTVIFSEAVNTPDIMILNNTGSVVVTQSGSSNIYFAKYITTNSDIEGIINFSINTTDIAGNNLVEVLSTSDSSQVIYDKTKPSFEMKLWPKKNTINMNYAVFESHIDPSIKNISDNLQASGSLVGKQVIVTDNRPAPGPNITGNYTIKYRLSDVAGNTKYLTRNVWIYGQSGGSKAKKMDVCNETNGDHSGNYYDGKCEKDEVKKIEENKTKENNKEAKNNKNKVESEINQEKIIKYTNFDIEKYKIKKENIIKYKDYIEKKYSKKISKISEKNKLVVILRIDKLLNNIDKYKLSEEKRKLIIELVIALKEILLSK